MLIRLLASCSLMLLLATPLMAADEYHADVLDSPAPEEVSEPIAKLLNAKGIKMVKGESRTICEVWLCKGWLVQADFEESAQILYPFTPGQLVGVLRFARKSADFRDQPISKGVYTLRYMQQPVDGNHVGTSPTRDFFLLVSAELDTDPAILDYKKLVKDSAAAAESSHPAMLCLQKAEKAEKLPAVRANEAHEWQILQFAAPAKAGEKVSDLPVDVVIEGIAAE
jgi:hypothetical protein